MVDNSYLSSVSARSDYEPPEPGDSWLAKSSVRKGLMLALIASAAAIVIVLPNNDGEDTEPFALETAEPPAADGADSPTSLQVASQQGRLEIPDPFEPDAPMVDGEALDDEARLALATDAALVGAEQVLLRTAGIVPDAVEAEAERQKATTTTAKPTTTSSDSTTSESTSTTAAGDTTSSSEDTTSSTDSSTTETSDTTAPDDSSTSSTDTSIDSSSGDATPDTTAPDQATTTTAASAGWLDTGNGVSVPKVLLDIRFCESRDNYTAANPSSSARGGYQFLTGSWRGYGHADRYGVGQAHLATPAQQDEAALITWQKDGTRPWNASKSCWSKR